MPRFPGFIGGSGVAQSLISDAEDTVNLYVEQAPSQAASNASALLPVGGFSQWTPLSTVGDVGTRAALLANGRLFKVIGAGFYEFDINGTPTKRGAVAVDGNPAQIIFNGVVGGQLGIASGSNFYVYVLATNTLTQVGALTGKCTQVAYAAGFGLAFDLNTGKVQLSNLNDLTTWNAGTFFQRSLFADPYQAMFVDANNLVWMVGTDTFEVRYNSGVGTQPFVPLSGLVGASGIVSPFAFATKTAIGNVWLARNQDGAGELVATAGGAPQSVSTFAFSSAVAGYLRTAKIDDAEVMTYQQEGHTFITVSFPSVPASWTFDAKTSSWARRGKWNANLGRFELWSPRVHVFAFNKHLVGDRASGVIAQMDTSITTEFDGSGIVRERTAPGLIDEHKRIPIDQLELLMDVGLGTQTGQGSDPQATLRVSVDGGRTFGNERRAAIGKIGEWRKRVYWTRLGAPAHMVVKVRFTDPAPSRIVDAFVNNVERGEQAA